MTKAIPDGYHTLTPMLMYKDTRAAIDFYKKAFGAKEKEVIPGQNGKGVMHAVIQIGDSLLMMGDESDRGNKSAETAGQSTVALSLYVPNADATFKQAVSAGATSLMPLTDMFWGDRAGEVKDPFGYQWWILTHTKDLSKEEMMKGAQAAMATANHG